MNFGYWFVGLISKNKNKKSSLHKFYSFIHITLRILEVFEILLFVFAVASTTIKFNISKLEHREQATTTTTNKNDNENKKHEKSMTRRNAYQFYLCIYI